MVDNAELAKEYNYRPPSKLSECQLDVNDGEQEHKGTGFNISPFHSLSFSRSGECSPLQPFSTISLMLNKALVKSEVEMK